MAVLIKGSNEILKKCPGCLFALLSAVIVLQCPPFRWGATLCCYDIEALEPFHLQPPPQEAVGLYQVNVKQD